MLGAEPKHSRSLSPNTSDKENMANNCCGAPDLGNEDFVSGDTCFADEELERLAPESALEEEHRLRDERVAREKALEPNALDCLPEEKFGRLDRLLDKASMFSTFLAEKMAEVQVTAAEAAKEEVVEEQKPKKGNKRKGSGSRSTGGRGKKAKTEKVETPTGPTTDHAAETKELMPHLQGELRDYQLKGVKWMISLWANGINGILADEMGLGKTVQTIGFLSHLFDKNVLGPYLIVGPLSTLPNWVNEFKRFVPHIPVVLYHGSKAERAQLRATVLQVKPGKNAVPPGFPVICTSFEIVMADVKFFQHLPELRYLIVDEGHRLKNHSCKLVRDLKQIRAYNKLLLTGTPLQNNLGELWSLFNFIMPDIFSDVQDIEAWFDFEGMVGKDEGHKAIIANEQRNMVVSKLHGLLKPFLLRRVKADVLKCLPPKVEMLLYAHMAPAQKQIHQQLCDKTLMEIVNKLAKDNGSQAQLSKLNNVMIQMRKNCNHPDLITGAAEGGLEYPTPEEALAQCGKLQLLNRLLQHLHSEGHKVLIFSQMTKLLDLLEAFLDQQGHRVCRISGNVPWQERQANIEQFNQDPEHWLFLLSTRAGGLGINLTAADTVIIYDSDWNPHQDLQAMDRAHRIGQQRPVMVLRLATAHSVETRMLQTAGNKLMLERLVIKKGYFQDVTAHTPSRQLSPEELVEILKGTSALDDKSQSGVVSDEMLGKLLDRSWMERNEAMPYPSKGVGYAVVQRANTGGMLGTITEEQQ